jgi:hypothetical protein
MIGIDFTALRNINTKAAPKRILDIAGRADEFSTNGDESVISQNRGRWDRLSSRRESTPGKKQSSSPM